MKNKREPDWAQPSFEFPLGAQGPLLTVLSHGMGQDSSTILDKLIFDSSFRRQWAPRDLLVLFAETGDEHPETYEQLRYTELFCLQWDIPFIHITPDLGYHSPSWQSLNHFYDTKKAIGSKAFPKTCTDKLKLVPIYKCLEDYLGERYAVKVGNKRGFREFAARFGKIRMLIGIAKGEEKRMSDPATEQHLWKKASIEVVYPLVETGYDRQACQDYFKGVGRKIPMPSNCRRCPFMSEQELLWMFRFTPAVYDDWVRQEQVKLEAGAFEGDITKTRNKKGEVVDNLGVWGKKRLPEVLQVAQEKFGHWSDEQLMDYKMSHGHCVASKY